MRLLLHTALDYPEYEFTHPIKHRPIQMYVKYPWYQHSQVEYGGAVVTASALGSKDREFVSHWVSTLATLGKLPSLSGPRFSQP